MNDIPPVRSPGGHSDETRPHRAAGTPGADIGPYRLLEPLGEGGMGEVWLAEQGRPLRRHVALKVIKAGMDTAHVVARFEAERQALAVMDHPAIAKVFDAGTTPQGRPYFAMEYVRGEPLTAYCDRQRLTTPERLELFFHVCEGVHHAHQKGIIHRDLKPTNILVTVQDDRPVPKIIDFGIAKAMTQPLTDRTLYTWLGGFVGTPEYVSPEQAEPGATDVDTRTDVYSLGVVLYELLTGALPFDRQVFKDRGLDEIRLMIRGAHPPWPSTRVTQLGPASTDAANNRRTEPARLASLLRGDLDWIVMKAIEKDRTRRYGSVSDLAADIQRHLAHQPVLAGPPSGLYRARKFVQRHRVAVAAAGAVVVLLVAFAAAMTVQAQRIAHERDRANREASRASQEAEAAQQVSDFLVGLFAVVDPSEARGNTITAREILDRGATRLEKELAGQPGVQGRLMNTVGTVYQSLGLYKDAEAMLRQSLETRRRAFGSRDPAVAASLHDLGTLLVRAGDLAGGEAVLKEAHALRESLFGADSAEVAATLGSQGELAYARGDYKTAETLFTRQLQTLRRLAPHERDEALSNSLNDLAMTIQQTRADYRGAIALLGESLQIRRRLFGANHPSIAQSLNNFAMAHYRLREYDAAEPLFREALASNRALFGEEHPEVTTNLSNLALVARERGDYQAASTLFEQIIALDRRQLGPNHVQVARTMNNWAESLRRGGEPGRAAAVLRESVRIQLKSLSPAHWQIASTKTMLARCLAQERRFAESERLLIEAYPVLEKEFGLTHPRVGAAIDQAAQLYDAWRKPSKAAEWRAKRPPAAEP